MKKEKRILFVICIVFILTLTACSSNAMEDRINQNQQSENTNPEPIEDTGTKSEPKKQRGDNKDQTQNYPEMEYSAIAQDNIKSIGDTILFEDKQNNKIDFTVESVEFSKQLQGRQIGELEKNSLDAYGVEYDAQGTILNDYSYIWMKVDVKALEKEQSWNPLQFIIVAINDDLTLYQDIGPYLFFFDGIQETENYSKDIFYKTFSKGVSTEVSLGFFTPDRVLDKKLGYFISEFMSPNEPRENEYIVKLN
ncbi:hypothetical protein DWX43_23115 [Clostridium sp. AF19-22AC]|jgi:PBP1b-binding outer membrane lipoprotein LpoB|uniref:hypothetical protein n=1 Tax=Clostridia TaxID=186801 RepID=UPI000E4F9832|nr:MULTISPECIES: hypothetical protein [Clostridia]RHR21905.1 hypothetical protein DWX43_23115 [Clostridium sp. AF19-22AC]